MRIINNIAVLSLVIVPGLTFIIWSIWHKKSIIIVGTLIFILSLGIFVSIKNNDKEVIKMVDTKEYKNIVNKDGATYINGIMIVNKSYPLSKDYYPKNTFEVTTKDTTKCNLCIKKEAYDEFLLMQDDSKKLGLNIYIQSGYRSYAYQEKIYNKYVQTDGVEKADTYSSRPGFSEHQSGLAFDLNSITDDFANTPEGKWVNDNAYKYGFVIRFPKGKEKYTGYKYESWHLRYVGKSLAKVLYNNGDWISLEEYLGVTSKYN